MVRCDYDRAVSAPPVDRYWDEVAGQWAGGRDHLWRRHSDQVNGALCRRWLPARARRVLKTDVFDEVSTDGLWPVLGLRAETVEGLDVSPHVAAEARRRHPGMSITVGDVRHLPYANASFDAVVSTSTLDHFADTASIDASLRELWRILTPGGCLILTLDNPDNPVVAMRNALPFTWLNRVGLVPYFVGATFNERAARTHLTQAGFEVVDTTAILHCPRVLAVPAARAVARFASRGALSEGLLWILNRFEGLGAWPTRFRTGHFVAVLARRPAAS